MKPATILIGLCLLASCIALPLARSSPPWHSLTPASEERADARSKDEKALGAQVAEFTRCFNTGDAGAISLLFAENARLVTISGMTIDGRKAIEALFAASFRENPGQTIAVKSESLRFLGADVAIEDGTATVTGPKSPADKEASSETTRFTVAYIKRDGKWLQDSIRDYPIQEMVTELTAHDHLKELEWLVGEWIDESDDGEVHTTCQWSDNESFLLRAFEVKVRGQAAMSGTQRIGWDPRLKQFRSWVFDSEGGFSEGAWSRDGDRWVIKTHGVLKDGRPATATNIVTRIGPDQLKWSSVDRTLGPQVLADAEEIVLVRKPPQPGRASKQGQPARTAQ
jgi:uncharacterized protein (TIGR02246 family)